MLRPDFAFIHTVKLQKWIKQGMNGPEYAKPETLRCRVNFNRHKTAAGGNAGQEVIASGTVWFAAGIRMEPESLIEFEGRTYSVLSCLPCYDFHGENHVEVELR